MIPTRFEGIARWGGSVFARLKVDGYLMSGGPGSVRAALHRKGHGDHAAFPLVPGAAGAAPSRKASFVESFAAFNDVGWLLVALLFFLTPPVYADDSSAALPTVFFRGQSYFVQELDPKKADIRLFWKDDQDQVLRDFIGLDKYVTSKGEHLGFAANAGMYESDLRPVGLLVLGGVEKSPLNLNDAPGNFYMKPNGVFLINEKHEAMVVESGAYPTLLTPVVWATQSGPLLVHGGSIHPEFNADSKSKKLRSGVGVSKEGKIYFALSRNPVNFYDFATLFLTKFKCPNALFLDGEISAFSIPGLRDPTTHTFGPMIGVIEGPK